MGRPRKTLPANGLDIIRDLAARGIRELDVAAALGMGLHAWRRIRQEDPAAKEAWEESKAREHDELVSAMYVMAMGKPAQFDGSGNKVRDELKPDPWAAAFLLKTRHGYRDAGQTDASTDNRVQIQITVPSAMTIEDYQKLLVIAPAVQDATERAHEPA